MQKNRRVDFKAARARKRSIAAPRHRRDGSLDPVQRSSLIRSMRKTIYLNNINPSKLGSRR
jgi:hypothetical protein